MVIHLCFVKIDSCDDLSIEERWTPHNLSILIKPVCDEDQNHYYYKIYFWEMFLLINEKIIGVKFFDNIRLLRYGRTNVRKENLCGRKKRIKI